MHGQKSWPGTALEARDKDQIHKTKTKYTSPERDTLQ